MMPLPIGDCRLPIGKTEKDLKLGMGKTEQSCEIGNRQLAIGNQDDGKLT
jgi:hypothetical protein